MKLNKKDYNKAKKIGVTKLVRRSLKLYNTLCVECKLKTIRINKRRGKVKQTDYCNNCQKKAEEIYRGL